MFKSWRLGRVLGFPIHIHLSFLVLLGVVLLGYGGVIGALVVTLAFGSVVLHELGHAVVARHLGVRVERIELSFLGGAAQMTNLPRTPRHELAIAAAGPLVSLVLGGVGLGLGIVLDSPFVGLIGWINFVIAAFNLIPALPMDGGRILRAALVPRLGYRRATDVAVVVARIATVAFVIVGLAVPMLQLLLLAPFLWWMTSHEQRIAQAISGGGFAYDHHGSYDDLFARRWQPPPPRRHARYELRDRHGTRFVIITNEPWE